uniref:Uncharacterized protein n=1 Tax=Hyaloperonospora arabidopsidis (strain Emoy2) TaxID=559515 RepID=M4C2X7_HYAAE
MSKVFRTPTKTKGSSSPSLLLKITYDTKSANRFFARFVRQERSTLTGLFGLSHADFRRGRLWSPCFLRRVPTTSPVINSTFQPIHSHHRRHSAQ